MYTDVAIATDSDIVAALALAIYRHPLIDEVNIYSPIDNEAVKIQKLVLYGGTELIDPGLTLAVYPAKRNEGTSKPSYSEEIPISIAQNHFSGAAFAQTCYFTVRLSYRVADFNTPISLQLSKQKTSCSSITRDAPSNLSYYASIEYASRSGVEFSLASTESIEAYVLPAEEVLRNWTTLLRYVIRDIRHIKPFGIRSPQILGTSYKTGEVFGSEGRGNLVFHKADIHIKLSYTEGNLN